jgi:acetyl-CoA acetyltransferase
MPIAGEVAIVGSAMTKFGVLHDHSYLDLLGEAALGAIADAGVAKDDVGAAWLVPRTPASPRWSATPAPP